MSSDDGAGAADLPIDPDIGPPAVSPRVVLAVFAGGIFGGVTRYEIGLAAAPHAGRFPWDIFAINVGGAFALALLIVLVADVLPPTTYVRPALGTGFLGAFTTFSSLAVAADELAAHHHAATASVYVVASAAAGLLAAGFGLWLGRFVTAATIRGRR
jgi:CrcB protein